MLGSTAVVASFRRCSAARKRWSSAPFGSAPSAVLVALQKDTEAPSCLLTAGAGLEQPFSSRRWYCGPSSSCSSFQAISKRTRKDGSLRCFSTTTTDDNQKEEDPDIDDETRAAQGAPSQSPFAVVRHGDAYVKSLAGLHGQTLEKAKVEGVGRDDPPFDPFLEDELLEQRLQREIEEEEAALKAKQEAASKIEQDASSKTAGKSEQANEEDEKASEEGEGDDEEITMDDLVLDDEDDSEMTKAILYNYDGSIRRKESQRIVLRAGSPSGGLFCIMELPGKQYKVAVDDVIVSHLLQPIEKYSVGSIHTHDKVLLVGSTHQTLIGLPYVAGATVTFQIEEITMDQKVIIFKRRRRKHSQRKRGFRRQVSLVRILDISMPAPYDEHEHVPLVAPDLLPNPLPDPMDYMDRRVRRKHDFTTFRRDGYQSDEEEEEEDEDEESGGKVA